MREIDDVSITLLENSGAASNVYSSLFHSHRTSGKLLVECSRLGRIDSTLDPIIFTSSKLNRLPNIGLRIIKCRILVHLEL